MLIGGSFLLFLSKSNLENAEMSDGNVIICLECLITRVQFQCIPTQTMRSPVSVNCLFTCVGFF